MLLIVSFYMGGVKQRVSLTTDSAIHSSFSDNTDFPDDKSFEDNEDKSLRFYQLVSSVVILINNNSFDFQILSIGVSLHSGSLEV